MSINARFSSGFSTAPHSPQVLPARFPSPHITSGANYFLYHKLRSGVLVQSCSLILLIRTKAEPQTLFSRVRPNLCQGLFTDSCCFISLWSSSSRGNVSTVNLSPHSHRVTACTVARHAGDSAEAVLNNNTRKEAVCPFTHFMFDPA